MAYLFHSIVEGLNPVQMLQIANPDVPTLTRHIEELKVYLDKMIREKYSPVRIQKHRYHIEQLQLLLTAKTAGAHQSQTA